MQASSSGNERGTRTVGERTDNRTAPVALWTVLGSVFSVGLYARLHMRPDPMMVRGCRLHAGIRPQGWGSEPQQSPTYHSSQPVPHSVPWPPLQLAPSPQEHSAP